MFLQAFTILLSFVLQVIARPHHPQSILSADDACPTGVHIVGVRATTEQQGFGVMQAIVDQLLSDINGSDAYAIVYPAAGILDHPPWVDGPLYETSEQTGVDNLVAHIVNFTEYCPDTTIVLLGYSQGAHVVGDTLCGRQGGGLFPPQPPLDPKYTALVKAIVQFGDPSNRRASNLPWHVGTSTTAGIFARFSIADCTYLGNNWQSYCDKGDPFCARGDQLSVHLHYVQEYGNASIDFIVKKVDASAHLPFGQDLEDHEL